MEEIPAADMRREPLRSDAATPPHGERWAQAFGLQDAALRHALRERYAFLNEQLVFRVDAQDMDDPLGALTASIGSANGGSNGSVDNVAGGVSVNGNGVDANADADANGKSSSWSQYFSQETLLQEINTDLDRLYPAGNEGFFQNEQYLNALRRVLFLWCKLHPDVSYRQGMHDVVAVVFYAFLQDRERKPAPSDEDDNAYSDTDTTTNLFGNDTQSVKRAMRNGEPSVLPPHIEADTFLVFESILLYIKPFYEVVKTPYQEQHSKRFGQRHGLGNEEPRLFANVRLQENDDPNHLFHGSKNAHGLQNAQPALSRLCQHVQYELMEQKDPQLYYHLKNLDIVPETYCLRWVRLLFAREYTFAALLHVWDGMIMDSSRRAIRYPSVNDPREWLTALPELENVRPSKACEDEAPQLDVDDRSWMGFPLLRYICVAKLLTMSAQLLKADNTGCLRLLMQSFNAEAIASLELHEQSAKEIVRFARVLQNPCTEQRCGGQGIDVVKFGVGSLGIVLTAAKGPFERHLAVKDFASDPSDPNAPGPAEASGRVLIGDLLHSINGVPIIGITTEEVKRHIQLISRPLYIGFRHCGVVPEKTKSTDTAKSVSQPTGRLDDNAGTKTQPLDVLLPLFLPGELCYANVTAAVQKFSLSHDGSCLAHYISGKLYITNYRCIFTRLLSPGEIDWQVAVLSIVSIDGADASALTTTTTAIDHAQAALGFSSSDTYNIVVRCKDMQLARLSFSSHTEYSKVLKCLTYLAYPTNLLDAFCFTYSPTIAPSEEARFDLRREYQRIGLLSCPDHLRCIDQSARYELCETYPQHLIVPSEISDVKIKAAAAFRSSCRLPVVCWLHPKNGATICRSSQPLVGLKSNRNLDDELLVRLLCCASNARSTGRYMIMDARSQLAAVGNKAMGKGTEIASNYRGAKLVFMNIDNIHSVRQSLQSLTAVFEPRRGATDDSNASFYGKVENSGWLRHVRLVLKASAELAHSIHGGVSVLTHCSDGWDRTAQMVALAELMLDPFYRTLRGFQCLIEKEWCSFGHQFAARCGHARSDFQNDQRSPVFLLWLDCVWQFLRQFPTQCEFNESLLLALADHVYSCKYGTFMFDCERQRKEFFTKHRAFSIWSDINRHSDRFTNALYAPSDDTQILSPSTLSKNIRYVRSSPKQPFWMQCRIRQLRVALFVHPSSWEVMEKLLLPLGSDVYPTRPGASVLLDGLTFGWLRSCQDTAPSSPSRAWLLWPSKCESSRWFFFLLLFSVKTALTFLNWTALDRNLAGFVNGRHLPIRYVRGGSARRSFHALQNVKNCCASSFSTGRKWRHARSVNFAGRKTTFDISRLITNTLHKQVHDT